MISFQQAQSKLKLLCESWIKDVGLDPEIRALRESLGFYLSQDLYAKQNLPVAKSYLININPSHQM